tara:strand:+ start:673 stop:1239 length:567 start_codon:yes stop_codon:yes gene_type:complete
MRIISGSAKGKKLFTPINKKTRPLKDMVRESIFNIIHHSNLLKSNYESSIVLDLYSGVGSFGLEAISRGFKKVIFFENYKPAVNLLKKNINNLSFNKKTKIYEKNINQENNFKKMDYKFDLIFLDPPFQDKNIDNIFNLLQNSKIIHSHTLIVLHRHKQTIDNLKNKLNIQREEYYGKSKIIFGYFVI